MTEPVRPTLVTVVAILAIIFGVLGIVCSPFAILPYVSHLGGPPNPVVDAIRQNSITYAWSLFAIAIGFVLSIVLLVAGVGALKLKAWARTTLMGYAIFSLFLGCIGTGMMAWALSPLLHASSLQGGDPAAVGGIVGGVVGGFCGAIFQIALQGGLLLALTRPNVKAAFGVE